jgi:hypothetical protein
MCGCGEKTKLAAKTCSRRGHLKGKPLRYIHGHHRRGGKFPTGKPPHNFNSGLTQRKDGRWYINCRDGSKVLYYRAVMEAHLGRELRPGEVVHHINGDCTDDRIENLRLFEDDSLHHRVAHAA